MRLIAPAKGRTSTLLLVGAFFLCTGCDDGAESGTRDAAGAGGSYDGGGATADGGARDGPSSRDMGPEGATQPDASHDVGPSSDSGARDVAADGGAGADGHGEADAHVDRDAPPAIGRGANLPFVEYEAELATTNGVVIGPSTAFGNFAAEASGRRAVRLDATGHKVEFRLDRAVNSIVLRYAIPDAPTGGGMNATLGLYVNGARKDVALTSRYAWTYGDEDAQGSGADVPSAGTPHHFYDEARALFDEVPAGATIALQRDAQDAALYYIIDLADFEKVAAPLARPIDYLSITDYGATADDTTDDGPAVQSAIDAAKAQGKGLWIPPGTFEIRFDAVTDVSKKNLRVAGITLRGAGMWYSVFRGFAAQLKVDGDNNRFHDFAIQGDVLYREDDKGYNGFDGPAGVGSRAENIWIEHVKCGWWVGRGDRPTVDRALTDGLILRGLRIRNTFADGVNFANGTRNSIVEQCHLRNTGDDALATWSFQRAGEGPPCENNVFRFNTVQTVWRATCFAVYGGKDHKIQDSVCADTSNYPGILLATTPAFQPWPFDGTTAIERNTLVRAGGKHYGYDHGALKFFAADSALAKPIRVTDLVIRDAVLNGIQFEGAQAIGDVGLAGVEIDGYGTAGLWVTSGVTGTAKADRVTVTGTPAKGLQNDSPTTFSFQKGPGNAGW